jgi:GT2 family glycosyltransferase
MRVTVCVITYQRPEGLKLLLEGLNRLVFDKCEAPSLVVIVVDNDSAGLACKFCEDTLSDFKWPLKCFVEPRRGIPYARNKAVACAQEEHADLVAFIDDDEVPDPFWLDELMYVQRLHNADAVTGPQLPRFTAPISGSFLSEEFFELPRYPTGHPMTWASTGNILIRSEVFEKMDKLFDERFALSGGSDTHFFRRALRAGYKFVWADDAVVHEWIPKSRANVRWLLQRGYRVGNVDSLCRLEFNPSIATRASLVAEASRRIVRGLLRLRRSLAIKRRPLLRIQFSSPIKVVRRRRLAESLRQVSRGAGMLAGTAGKRYEEYRKTHGT